MPKGENKKRDDRFGRRKGAKRSYHKLFIIATEGEKTEPQYFEILRKYQKEVAITPLKGDHKPSPLRARDKMKEYLEEEQPHEPYEAWIVIDRDEWEVEELRQIVDWAKDNSNYGFALSNPKFEYWLLLHFEDGKKVQSPRNCDDRLKKCYPKYNKNIDARKITRARINDAIKRAKARDYPPCKDWPRAIGVTTVYRLVEKILNHPTNDAP